MLFFRTGLLSEWSDCFGAEIMEFYGGLNLKLIREISSMNHVTFNANEQLLLRYSYPSSKI